MNKPTPEDLRSLLRYDPETGRLFWLPRPAEIFASERHGKTWNARFANAEAFTSNDSNGYRSGRIHGKTYRAHRVIWALVYGEWPPEQIDHINGVCGDNRLENLRAVSVSVNARNQKMLSNNTSGHNGVSWCKTYEKWRARIDINGKNKHLGCFDNIADAVAARKAAEVGQGFTGRHGVAL